jgi:hypothetical protein
VETVFADLKDNHTLGRARLRGWAFEVQALLAAAAHNIERLVKGRALRARAQAAPAFGWPIATYA